MSIYINIQIIPMCIYTCIHKYIGTSQCVCTTCIYKLILTHIHICAYVPHMYIHINIYMCATAIYT